MSEDEKAIRELVSSWMAASRAGDTATVLKLMSDDAVFMVPGREPFGKGAFAASSGPMKDMTIDGTSEIVELKILGDWAWLRNRLRIVVTPASGDPIIRAGHTLTILQKMRGGNWALVRDANLLTVQKA